MKTIGMVIAALCMIVLLIADADARGPLVATGSASTNSHGNGSHYVGGH